MFSCRKSRRQDRLSFLLSALSAAHISAELIVTISCNGKLVGGITFDFTGEEFNDNEEFAKSKCEEAFNVCSDVAEDLALAYFNKKRVF